MSRAHPARSGAHPSRGLPPERGLVRQLQAAWLRLCAGWARRRIDRDTQAALHALDGRALHDLGLDRSQIPSLAAAAARFGPGRALWQLSADTHAACGLPGLDWHAGSVCNEGTPSAWSTSGMKA